MLNTVNDRNRPQSAGKTGAVLLLLALLALGACVRTAPAPVETPRLDVTFLPQKGEFVSKYGDQLSLDEITALTRDADYILVGEGHRNVCDHKVQQALLGALARSEKGVSVGLEMVAVDKNHELDDFAKGQVDVDGLEEELQWSATWGYPYTLFKPLFFIVQRNSLPVAGLNVPARVIKKIGREGLDSLTEEERAFLPAEIVPPAPEQIEFLDEVYALHEGKDADNATARDRFRLVQSVWDSKMAEEAVRLRRQYDWPVFVVAGSGHVENGWGIARRIHRFDPGAKVVLLMPWRGGEFDQDAGDAFFYCPDSYQSKMGATLTDTGQGGLLVERVARGSRADKAGLRPGDVLVRASGIDLEHLFDLHRAGFKVHNANEPLVFTVRRGGKTVTVDVGRLGVFKPKAKPAAEPEANTEAADDPRPEPADGGADHAEPQSRPEAGPDAR